MIVRQFVVFGLVGSLGFIVDTGVLYLLVKQLAGNLYYSRLLSYCCAATVTWKLNQHFTFANKAHKQRSQHHEWLRYLCLNMFGATLNYAIYSVLVFNFQLVQQQPVIGVAAGSLAAMLVNFCVCKYYVFAE
jgi:putative flippase GtrA